MPKKFAKKYIIEDRTDGVLRFYFRKRGQPKIRLHGIPGTDEFNEQYYRALKGVIESKPAGPVLAKRGTLRWLCEQYFGSAEYKMLDARTRKVRRSILESCWAEPTKPDGNKMIGDMPLSSVTSKVIRVLRDRKAEKPEAANSRVKALRQVFGWGVLDGVELAMVNPAKDVPYFKPRGQGFHSWTEAEVARFEERHPIGTKARLAFGLLFYLAQRRSDIVLFGKQHRRGDALYFTQFKGRNRNPVTLEIPIPRELVQIIDATPSGDMTFLVNDLGRPFTANGFGNKMREWCDQAGLPECTSHGLRKARAARMADRGATGHQIMAITGHQTLKEVDRYTRAANQRRLAKTATAIMEKQTDDD
ncbi:tyrosine-type recombinase/integrase [Devosia sp. Naph2]|uniref:tyrosine-type recombinase/integrase n=1 Tax=Devosia polycyclovorans TaxID=3345148 RepID=UPI0035CE9D9A